MRKEEYSLVGTGNKRNGSERTVRNEKEGIFGFGTVALTVTAVAATAFVVFGVLYAYSLFFAPADERPDSGTFAEMQLPAEVKIDYSDSMFDFFVPKLSEKMASVKSNVAVAPLLNEISVTSPDGAVDMPASVWALSVAGEMRLEEDMPGRIPFTRLESGYFVHDKAAATPVSIRFGDKTFSFPETPVRAKTLTAYQRDVGPVALTAVFTWPDPMISTFPEWEKAFSGMRSVAVRKTETPSGTVEQELFLHGDGGARALVKLRDGVVVYADASFESSSFAKYADAAKDNVSTLPGKLPEAFSLGDWAWRERGVLNSDFVKSRVDEGEFSINSLVRWSSDGKANEPLVYGLARTWHGYLLDISLWFDRTGWEKVNKNVFSWFGMEAFSLAETREPVARNGLEMTVDNMEDKMVLVNIRDTKLVQLLTAVSEGLGENGVVDARNSWASSRMRLERPGETTKN